MLITHNNIVIYIKMSPYLPISHRNLNKNLRIILIFYFFFFHFNEDYILERDFCLISIINVKIVIIFFKLNKN